MGGLPSVSGAPEEGIEQLILKGAELLHKDVFMPSEAPYLTTDPKFKLCLLTPASSSITILRLPLYTLLQSIDF